MSNNVVQPARMSLVLPSRTHVFLFYFIFRVLCPYQSLWVNSFFFFVYILLSRTKQMGGVRAWILLYIVCPDVCVDNVFYTVIRSFSILP